MNLTGQQIYDALLRDPSFTSQIKTETARAIWRDLCEIVPETLSEFLTQPVSVTSIMNAKIAFLKKLTEGDWIQRMAEAFANELFGANEFSELMKDTLGMLIEAIPEILGDVPAFLASQEINEEMFLGHEKGGRFTEATMTRWKQGNLTIAELLTMQPASIIQND